MITIESVLSKKNQNRALNKLSIKANGGGTDQSPLTEFRQYWDMNKERIIDEIKTCQYQPRLVREYEIVNGKGKKRSVTNFEMVDRFLTRLLSQKLNQFYQPLFQENSYAYQENKGIQTAVQKAREYIEAGNEYIVEIDVQNFFDEVNLNRMMELLKADIKDKAVLHLIENYLYCDIANDGEVRKNTKGLLQGNSFSPVLSNLYLQSLDLFLEESGYKWIRFADDLNIYVDSKSEGVEIFELVSAKLRDESLLSINTQKSGVFEAYERRFLGYDFRKKSKSVIVEKHVYQKKDYYRYWHTCAVERVNKEYHIVQNGTLNKKDYALLFENSQEKHHIPVEATTQLNVYNEITLTSSVVSTLYAENIRLAIYNKYGNLLGYFVPECYTQDAKTFLAQCRMYNDEKKRLQMARKMEIAAIHNIRANVRYYNKHKKGELTELVDMLTNGIKELNECKTIDQLLLVEGRCRQNYYHGFNRIINNPLFEFINRSKRPPKDRINALISFGNTLLYNRIQQIIWKTSLDSQIGIFHAANKRHYSLNLDFADLFKPIIVDRVIFTLINRGQMKEDSFIYNENGSVYLNEEGKRLFISSFTEKMETTFNYENRKISYNQLIETEIRAYLKHVVSDAEYKPYKYY